MSPAIAANTLVSGAASATLVLVAAKLLVDAVLVSRARAAIGLLVGGRAEGSARAASPLRIRGAVANGDRQVSRSHARSGSGESHPGPTPKRRLLVWAMRPPAWFLVASHRARSPLDPVRAWRGWIGLVVAPVASGAFVGRELAIGLALVAAASPAGVLLVARNRRDHAVEVQLPTVLEIIARSMRSGHSLRTALTDAAVGAPQPIAAELRAVVALVERGVPLVTALELWASRRNLAAVRLAVAALALGAEAGGPQARAVDGVATTLRERLGLRREARAQSAQARASAGMIVLAPLVFTGLSAAADARTADFLFRSGPGWACLVVGLSLDAVAAWWMARIVDRSAAAC